ncbi:MAG: hypothetical protein LBI10_08020 [Deltaproteobacteria bacterium]|nr:hypothetical protein [Deltaproteobacteria bacterium]
MVERSQNQDFEGRFAEEWSIIQSNLKKPSILVMGGSGTGKSALVNLVFKQEIATVGGGRPVTRGIIAYDNPYLTIYDSEGYESGDEDQTRYNNLIFGFIEEKARSVDTAVDIVWYCLSGPSARFTSRDAEIIRQILALNKPLALVITHIDVTTAKQVEGLTAAINEYNLNAPIFWSSIDMNLKFDNGLDQLHEWSKERLDESRRFSFIAASNRDLAAKEHSGAAIIKQHIVAAFAFGFAPIPFADAPILIANQVGLLARLSTLWNMSSLKDDLVATGGLEIVMANIGRTLSANLLKLIPGVGSLLGGAINGALASALTYALGIAFNKLCRRILEDQLAGKKTDILKYLDINFFPNIKNLYDEYKKNKSSPSKI